MRRGWVNEGSEGGSERALGREEGGKKESEAKRAQKSPGGKGASSQR